jgi:ATP-dependent RNA helicase DHX8/PRP22
MDDLEQFELLSLTSAIQREMLNFIGMDDKVLAEFLLSLHDASKDLTDFRAKLQETGSDFPDTFITSIDRLILTLHPKYKKKSVAKKAGVVETDPTRKLFPGLAMPDSDMQPSFLPDEVGGKIAKEKGIDDIMKEFEDAAKLHGGLVETGERKRKRTFDDARDNRETSRRRDLPNDNQPVIYKIYSGKVTGIKDFGAFVALEGINGRAEGEIALACGIPTHMTRRHGTY